MPVSVTAQALALAMDIPRGDIHGAHFGCQESLCTVTETVAVLGMAPNTWFPVAGDSFALLSTGPSHDWATFYPTKHYTMSYATWPNALRNTQGQDLTQLQLQLEVPMTATCLSFDYTFYTADLPSSAFAGRPDPFYPYNDTFTAQLNEDTLEVITPTTAAVVVAPLVEAPDNFALTRQGDMISVNTIDQVYTALALSSPPGTTYPGVFSLLKARTPVTSGTLISLNLSIQDLGDSLGNSAVALDNFEWLTEAESDGCQTGISGDQDGDGLPDRWETDGRVFCRTPGHCEVIDLKSLGANPAIKDVFVEIDSMRASSTFDPVPIADAIAAIVDAFARAPVDEIEGQPGGYHGIRLHVDYGPTAPLTWSHPLTATENVSIPLLWGDKSRADRIEAKEFISFDGCVGIPDEQVWIGLQSTKRDNFELSRSEIFHYGLFAHMFHNCGELQGISGASSNLPGSYFTHGASDFVVTFGHKRWRTAIFSPTDRQAGTFMHELGHNFGLTHSGNEDDNITHKPNHLSVMNYLYQLGGLVVNGESPRFNYVHEPLSALNEVVLDEFEGLQRLNGLDYHGGARHFCANGSLITVTTAITVNWNCNSNGMEANVRANINKDNDIEGDHAYTVLSVESEWDKLVFTGGHLNRQRNLVNSGVILVPVIDPLSGEVTRQAYYRNIRPLPISTDHLLEELQP